MSAANSLEISPTKIVPGTEAEIPVVLTADGAFTGFQAEITLSGGLSFVAPGAELGTAASQSHQLSANIDGNTLKLVCFSNANSTFATSGSLLNLKVKASDTFDGGTISITNAIFSSTGNAEVIFPDTYGNIEVKNSDPLIYSYDEANLTATVTGASEDLVDLVIPDTVKHNGKTYKVTAIGDYAFYDRTGFTGSLTIGNYVTEIGEAAFYGCAGFTGSLTIPNSVTEIGGNAFYSCHRFTGSLTIGNSVTTIGENAFRGCSGFTGELNIPNSVTTIKQEAFALCYGFTGSLTISNSVTEIGVLAFADCSGFTGSLTIPDSVTKIGESAFSGCSGFTGALTIPDSVTKIGESAFSGCSGFTGALTIPESITEIGDEAFYDCTGLSDIRVYNPEPIKLFDYYGNFYNPFPEEIMIRIPAGTGEKYRQAEVWEDYDAADRLYEFGDANLSKSLTVTDAVAAANNIIGAGNETFDFICADINQDDRVSISDVTGIIDAVLQYNPAGAASARRMPLSSGNTMIADNFAPDSRGDAQVGVHLVADTEFVALQADIAAGDGITVDGVELSPELTATHSLTTARLDDGTVRVILFSAANAPVRTNGGTVMTVSIHADGEAAGIAMNNIIGATARASESALGFRGGVNTGYAGIGDVSGGEITVTAADGNIVITNAGGTDVTVTDIAGRTVARFTANSDCCTVPMQHGIYIVSVGSRTAKIVL